MFAQPNITQWGYSIPVVPADVTNAVSLAGSTSSSLALRPNGTVRAWGNWAAMTNVPTGLSNVVMIAYRDFQNLILKSDGTIASWGSSTFTNIPAGITNIVAICAGYDHSLALRSDGTCLTLNAPLNNPMIVPSAVSNIVGVAAGQSFSLVVLANTRLLAYGPISAPTNLDRVVSVASGYRHALALRDDGTVVAFGENASGQCNVPAGLSNVISIAAGYSHSMALQSDGTVVSWGDLPSPTNLINVVAIAAGNDFGTAISGVGEPFIVTALQNRSAYVGERTAFYALASGSWPLSYQWQLNGTNIPGATSNTLVIPAVFASDAGEYSVIVTNPYGSRVISAQLAVIDFDPAVGTTNLNWSSFGVTPWAIETNIFRTGPSALVSGQLQYPGSQSTSTLETRVAGPATLTFWSKVSCDVWHKLSFSVDGSTWAEFRSQQDWQHQTFYLSSGSHVVDWTFSGIFSNPTNQFAWIDDVVVTPGATAPFLADSPPDQVQGLGADVHLSVSPQGTPPFSYQWRFGNSEIPGATGANFMITNIGPGKVGEYSVVVSNQAGAVFSQPAHISSGSIAIWGNWVLPPAFTNAVGLGAGEYHWLAIQPDHTVLSWGLACCAQTNVPPNLSNVVAVAGGAYFSLALTMDGQVVAWGESSYGQLNIPQDLSNVVAIVGGQNHALALKNDGAVVAWGDNSYGQTNIPSTLTNVVSIAAGGNNSMALSADGTVTVWGTNYSTVTNVPSWIQDVVAISVGQDHCLALKGDGTITAWGNSSLTNVPSDLTNVVAISAGSSHDLALRSDGKVTSWGWNFGGDTDVPQQLSNISVIQVGGYFSLALVGSVGTKNSVGISNFQRTGNSFAASVRSDLHRVYRLEYQTQLGNGNWIGLPLARGNGGVLVLTDSLAGDSQRFYRVRSW